MKHLKNISVEREVAKAEQLPNYKYQLIGKVANDGVEYGRIAANKEAE